MAEPPNPVLVTIPQVVAYFGGDVSYEMVKDWIRRDLVQVVGHDSRGRRQLDFAAVLAAEAATWRSTRGRPRGAGACAAG
jgi:hypothetical protein